MLQRPKHKKLPDFGVRFVGYSADVIARKGHATYATLDFISGLTVLTADEGSAFVPKRNDLASLIADLPLRLDELKALVKSTTPPNDDRRIEMLCGESKIQLDRGADVERFVGQITRRYHEIEQILEQAEKIGSAIERLPYADYVDEIARTGICRVVFYGDGLVVNGSLLFRPDRRTLLVKPTEDERTFFLDPR